jgi:hypothetical protein
LHRGTHLVSGHHLLQGVGTHHITTEGTQAKKSNQYGYFLYIYSVESMIYDEYLQ